MSDLAWGAILLLWITASVLAAFVSLILGAALFVLGGTLIAIFERKNHVSRH